MNVYVTNIDPVCDFCSSTEVVVGYMIEDFALPEYGWGSKGGFAACARCRDLIESRQYSALESRALGEFFSKHGNLVPYSVAKVFVHRLHTEFWKRLLKLGGTQ